MVRNTRTCRLKIRVSVVRFRPWPPSCPLWAIGMAKKKRRQPLCIVISGPNGAGKTTFARDFLTDAAGVVHFINADLIAGGLSPLDPKLAAVAAGRLVLREMKRLAALRVGGPPKSRFVALPLEFAKVDTTFREKTLKDVSRVDGRISSRHIDHWRTRGRCMTIPGEHLGYWSVDRDPKEKIKQSKRRFCCRSRPSPAQVCSHGAPDSSYARDPCLHLGTR